MSKTRKCENCKHIKLTVLSAKKSQCEKTGKEIYPKTRACEKYEEKVSDVRIAPIFKTDCETNYWGTITVESFRCYGDEEIVISVDEGSGAEPQEICLTVEKVEKMATAILDYLNKKEVCDNGKSND